jgi:hypothetical protein
MSKKTKSVSQVSTAAPEETKYSIVQAFDYFYGPKDMDEHAQLNDERGIRAAAFLLTYSSQHGNEVVDGNAANGLARILEYCATRIGFSPRPPEWPIDKKRKN